MSKKFFKWFKAFYFFLIMFLSIIYAVSIVFNIIHLDIFLLVLINIVFIFIALIMIFIYDYYKNMTIDIKFSSDDIILITNKEKFIFPKKQVLEILETPGRIVLNCYVNGRQKHFLYQTLYFPFIKGEINVKYLKDNLPNCKFSTGMRWSLYYWR